MNVQQSFVLSHEAQHLIFKRLGPSLALVLSSLVSLLLLPLETLWNILLMKILLSPTSIGKFFMVSQCRSVVGWKVVVGFEIIASIATHKLSLLHLIGTLMSKSLISHVFLLASFFYSHSIY